jgi:hypothetical protein
MKFFGRRPMKKGMRQKTWRLSFDNVTPATEKAMLQNIEWLPDCSMKWI